MSAPKVHIVSLGCPKNQVDADVFSHALHQQGWRLTGDAAGADAIVINTCGFIQSAKEEAIEEILAAAALKQQNPALKLVVTGCLAERYRHEVATELPEVDAVVGIGANAALPALLASLRSTPEKQTLERYGPKSDLPLGAQRVIGTPGHYAWLKIADGCSNACSYCAIPQIRGPLRSRSVQSVVNEAAWLAQQGVREIILVAQDTTAFGDDLGENQIVPLLHQLNSIESLRWIRLLYAYPERITKELLQAMRQCGKVLPYLDLPVQHFDEEILRSMGRKGGAQVIRQALALIKSQLPAATLRTTLIAGYPGESEAQFETLCQFVKDAQFDHLGCFAYSPEEGTRAAGLPGLLPEAERARRAEVITEIQDAIVSRKQQQQVGTVLEAVCDRFEPESASWLCRSAAQAPEIDGYLLVEGAQPLQPGSFYRLRITRADNQQLHATLATPATIL